MFGYFSKINVYELANLFHSKIKIMSYYQFIDGVRYTRDLIDTAKSFTQGRGESRISFDEIRAIYQVAQDGSRITDTERRTLSYIAATFTLTDKASNWLLEKLEQQTNDSGLKTIINRLVRQEFGLNNLKISIDSNEVKQQELLAGPRGRMFEAALRGAIEAYLFRSIDQLSFGAFVSRQASANAFVPIPLVDQKAILDMGTLFLVPSNESALSTFALDVPPDLDVEEYWVFLLQIPQYFPATFIAFVARRSNRQFSKGYISTKPSFDKLSQSIIKNLLGYNELSWQLPTPLVNQQLELLENQNFGNALFAALNAAIYNGESSISFRDFIQEEIWVDPDRNTADYMRDYINTGTLYLIPKEEAHDTPFPLPSNLQLSVEREWYFGLTMPNKTQVKFIINIPRDADDGSTGWNDGFILPDNRPILEQLKQQLLTKEFDVPNMELIFPVEEFDAQRTQFGRRFRNPQSLLRQAINTLADDYISRYSIFNMVANVHREEINPDDFESPLAYRSAIRQRILQYLKTGFMELLPIELPDNNPINGEPIEEFWQFFVMLPDLSEHGFWVIIPREPENGRGPYAYGVH